MGTPMRWAMANSSFCATVYSRLPPVASLSRADIMFQASALWPNSCTLPPTPVMARQASNCALALATGPPTAFLPALTSATAGGALSLALLALVPKPPRLRSALLMARLSPSSAPSSATRTEIRFAISIPLPQLLLDGRRQTRDAARDDALDVQALFELHARHQYGDGHVRAAPQLLDAFGLAVAAFEARQWPVVLLDVLGHQHDVPLGVLDEIGVAAAHQLGDLRLEAFATDTPVQRKQHRPPYASAPLGDTRPGDARADVERGQPVLVLVKHLGGEALDERLLDHGHLARDVAAHALLEFGRPTGDAVRDRLLDLVAELAAP